MQIEINHSTEDRRITLTLTQADGGYRWREDETGDVAETTASTPEGALQDADAMWSAPEWGLELIDDAPIQPADDITRTSTVQRLAAARAQRQTTGDIAADLRDIAGYTDADLEALAEADLREIAYAVEVAAERLRAEDAGESWIEVVIDGPRTSAVGPYVEYGPGDDGLEVEAIVRGWTSGDGRKGWSADYSSQITIGSGEYRRYRVPLVRTVEAQ